MSEESTPRSSGWSETIKTIAWALVLAGLIRTLLFQPFWIPSGSMKDTLLIGDFLFVNKMAYGYSRHSCPWSLCPISGRIWGALPERGDVVVFKHPVTGADFIKRVIGLPGDRVQVRAGVLHINGEPVKLVPAGDFVEKMEPQGPGGHLPRCANAPVPMGGDCIKHRFRETLPGGRTHDILEIDRQTSGRNPDNTPVFTVPPGHVFVMGDNRDNSQDSRFPRSAGGVGYVPIENIVGRADRIIFSSGGRSLLYVWTWRGGRFFKAIE